MKVLLLCGYRSSSQIDEVPGLARDPSGQYLIDGHIQKLTRLGFEVVCVVAGPSADLQLRRCPRIANAELVFDTTDTPNVASNIKAGLEATEGEGCFAIPVEIPPPDLEVWHFLRENWRQRGFHHPACVFQVVDSQGAPHHFGFPLLITRAGNKLIRETADFRSLADPRLDYHRLIWDLG